MNSAFFMIICYVAAALSVLSFLITLFIFFKLDIIGVIGDLSGSTARKGIESIRSENAKTGNKAHKTSHTNRERGKLTDKITLSGSLKPRGESIELSVGTEKFSTGKLENEAILSRTGADAIDETTILNNGYSEGTTVLNGSYSDETTVLSGGYSDETTVLSGGYSDETTVLSGFNAENDSYLQTQLANAGITIEDEIIFVHSNERIN